MKTLLKHALYVPIFVGILLSGCGSTSPSQESSNFKTLDESVAPTKTTNTYAFYGDTELERVIAIDINNMELINQVNTTGENTYTVGQAGDLDKLYAITRGSDALDVIDLKSMALLKTIALKHHPRSCAYNAVLGLQLVSGVDKVMTSVIDVETDTVVAVVGDDVVVSPKDYGGSNATGHPFWLTSNQFAQLNRDKRQLEIYKISKCENGSWSVSLTQCIKTPTSPHHIIGVGNDGMNGDFKSEATQKDIFYLVTEGSQKELIPPKLLELTYNQCDFSIRREVSLPNENAAQMGAHHATQHPTEPFIYMASTNQIVYVIDTELMSIIATAEAGIGAAHTTFAPQKELAVITNHMDTFVTIIDTVTHTKLKDVNVSGVSQNGTILQSHTSYVDPQGDFFYAFATDNGIFYELDLTSLEVSRTVKTNGTPKQGCFLEFTLP